MRSERYVPLKLEIFKVCTPVCPKGPADDGKRFHFSETLGVPLDELGSPGEWGVRGERGRGGRTARAGGLYRSSAEKFQKSSVLS